MARHIADFQHGLRALPVVLRRWPFAPFESEGDRDSIIAMVYAHQVFTTGTCDRSRRLAPAGEHIAHGHASWPRSLGQPQPQDMHIEAGRCVEFHTLYHKSSKLRVHGDGEEHAPKTDEGRAPGSHNKRIYLFCLLG